ncbi:MAG: hypothetical protein S4CHLAM123_13180 [Chlamydiales bacterium]|nr:hypothetical protein [Chlamydiales bacterium]
MNQFKEQFQQQGWFVFDLLDPKPVLQTRAFLKEALFKLCGKQSSLEEYHTHFLDDQEHTEMQVKLTQMYREQKCGPSIIEAQLPFFQDLLGPDLSVQANPYLRITRPCKKQDNIGYHRDTFYGGSPFELSVFIPFVDLPKESSLSVLPGSHVQPDTHYPTTQVENSDTQVRKGTAKHQLGFLYAPKMMDSSIEEQMHALAPVDLSARADYYQPLSHSVVTQSANQYLKANGQETRKHVELELCHTAS